MLQTQAHESTWDEGVIRDYMKQPTTQYSAYDLAGGHTLLLASHRSVSRNNYIAERLQSILDYIGPNRPFHVLLWCRDDPRKLGAKEWPTKRSVNGGWTTPGASYICIYREEEWERVVFHEMIHALEWDWKMPETPDPCWGAAPGYYMTALFEAWTELLAEWFWCAWTDVRWEDQRQWQTYQALQILARHPPGSNWSENTSVFAYYILKTALSPHMPFLWLHQNGDTAAERSRFLCSILPDQLQRLQMAARNIRPEPILLRMTVPQK